MTRKNKTPKFPDSYIGEKSAEYNSSKWMERNQKRTTYLCLQYLYDKKLDELGKKDVLENNPYTLLDLGCGTGFSSEILVEEGFRVIGIEILLDMLIKAKLKMKKINNEINLHLLLADMKFLPLRNNSIDHIISISAYNFILHNYKDNKDIQKIVNNTAKSIRSILKMKGRVIIEFYPRNEEELRLFSSSFSTNGYDGFLIKKNPNQKKGQTFLLLKKR